MFSGMNIYRFFSLSLSLSLFYRADARDNRRSTTRTDNNKNRMDGNEARFVRSKTRKRLEETGSRDSA